MYLQQLISRQDWKSSDELSAKMYPLHRVCSLPHIRGNSDLVETQSDIMEYYLRVTERVQYLISQVSDSERRSGELL